MMIQQNIDHIINTMIETFQYSDTIVRVKESGEVVRLKAEKEKNGRIRRRIRRRILLIIQVYYNIIYLMVNNI